MRPKSNDQGRYDGTSDGGISTAEGIPTTVTLAHLISNTKRALSVSEMKTKLL